MSPQRNDSEAGRSALLQENVTRSIRRAALREMARQGLGRLSMDTVARRAGVGKAALYRRWPTKEEMIVGVLSDSGLEFAGAPDTGSLEGDVSHYIKDATRILTRPLMAKLLPHLYAEMMTDTVLSKMIHATIQPMKQQRAGEIVERAIARGELPGDVNRELALDVLAGPLYWRMMVMKGRIDASYVTALTRFTIAGLLVLGGGRAQKSGAHPAARSSL